MHWQFTPYILPLLLSAAVTAALAAYAWRHRAVPGGTPFAVAMVLVALWSGANALEMAGADLPTKILWANLQYLSYAVLPVAVLAFGLDYTGQDRWLTRGHLGLLCLLPLATVVLVWTNDLHGLVRGDVRLDGSGPFPVIARSYRPWFWVHSAYSYLLLGVCLLLLGHALMRAPGRYRGQPLMLLLGLAVPLASQVLYLLGRSPIPGVDVTPISFSLMGALLAWGLFRCRLFDLVPVPHHRVIDGISDGVVILDRRGRVVYLNPGAQQILGCPPQEAVGARAEELLVPWPELLRVSRDESVAGVELALGTGEAPRYYGVRASPLADGRGRPIGRVITLREVTRRRKMEEALRESEQKYREMADALPETIWEIDLEGRVTFVNRAGLEMFGLSAGDLARGISGFDLLAPQDRQRARDEVAAVLRDQIGELPEYTALRRDGSTFPCVISSRPVLRGGTTVGLRGFLVDISDRKRAQARLLEQQRALAILEERERLARELHDSLGQVLGYVNTQAQAVRELLARGQVAAADAHLARLVAVAQESHADVREYILGAKSAPSPEQGFLVALERHLRRFGQNHGILTELVVADGLAEVVLEPAVQVQLLRIVQEALANVRKHARAHSVRVDLVARDGELQVTIEDDGRGFDPAQLLGRDGHAFGLRIMRERAEESGGSLRVRSTPGRGTAVVVTVPGWDQGRSDGYESAVGG